MTMRWYLFSFQALWDLCFWLLCFQICLFTAYYIYVWVFLVIVLHDPIYRWRLFVWNVFLFFYIREHDSYAALTFDFIFMLRRGVIFPYVLKMPRSLCSVFNNSPFVNVDSPQDNTKGRILISHNSSFLQSAWSHTPHLPLASSSGGSAMSDCRVIVYVNG